MAIFVPMRSKFSGILRGRRNVGWLRGGLGVTLVSLGGGFGYGVVGRDLEERRIGLGANDILHCYGGLRAGLGVLGNGEDDGGKIVGAPSLSYVIVGGGGGFDSAGESCGVDRRVRPGTVRFDSLDDLHAEVYSLNAIEVVEKQAPRAEWVRRDLNP